MLTYWLSDYVLVLGGFNLPRVEWSDHVPLLGPGCNQNVASALEYLMNNLSLRGLVQMNHVCSCLDSILDLIFCSNTDVVISPFDDPLLKCDSFHPALIMQFYVHPSHHATVGNNVSHTYDFKHGDYSAMCNR